MENTNTNTNTSTSTSEITPTLCLNMIVKNEAAIICRLFETILPIIDCYCICDTGSVDNTIELIGDFFKKHSIPGKIVHRTFENFAINRNYALEQANGMSDYVLLLDADMKLKIGNSFCKNSLNDADTFILLQGSDDFYYQNVRIIKNNGLYHYSGVTHEFINTPSNLQHIKKNMEKNQLFIEDYGDGGCKNDKYQRDILLLQKGIEYEPDNVRYYFYLANSYHDVGQWDDCIRYYKKRIEMGGWQQEVWYSYYRIGLSYKKQQEFEKAIFYWMEAYQYFPDRIENLYEIIYHYRVVGKHKLAKIFYDICKKNLSEDKILLEKDSYLFLQNNIYTYEIDYEYTIIACYLGIKNIDKEIVKVLNCCKNNDIINNLLSNMKFYKNKLQESYTLDLSRTFEQDLAGKMRVFYSSSTSILPFVNKTSDNKGKYLLNVRFVNYTIDKQGCYHGCEDYIITLNQFIVLDENFVETKTHLFQINDEPENRKLYMGTEDIRFFPKNNNNVKEADDLIFIGTGYHNNKTLGIVVGSYDTKEPALKVQEIKSSFSKNECEKNWVYVFYKGENHIVYNWFPLTICKINGGSLELIETKIMPPIFSRVRGSSCAFYYEPKKEHWFIVHIVSYEQPRHYYHMFVVFNDNLELKKYSPFFSFEKTCIEYNLGLIVEDNRVIIPYSVWDNKTKLAIYHKDYIDAYCMFFPSA
jgi:tetratricopeptide (TPR) repeat protein